MSFNGIYQLESHENFVPFMRVMGLPDEFIEKGKNMKSVSEIVQNGDHFTVKVTTDFKVLVNSFTVGQECEMETFTGEKVKATMVMEDNKLKVTFQGIESVTEKVDDDTIINTLTVAGVSYKRISKRIKS